MSLSRKILVAGWLLSLSFSLAVRAEAPQCLDIFASAGIPMLPGYSHEDTLPAMDPYRARYFTASEKAVYEWHIVDGAFRRVADGSPVNTGASTVSAAPFTAIFVRARDGSFYGIPIAEAERLSQEGRGSIFHSSFVDGDAVLFAGRITVINGRVTYVDNGSGHYKPTPAQLSGFMRWLQEQGVDMTQVRSYVSGLTPFDLDDSAMVAGLLPYMPELIFLVETNKMLERGDFVTYAEPSVAFLIQVRGTIDAQYAATGHSELLDRSVKIWSQLPEVMQKWIRKFAAQHGEPEWPRK